MTRRGPRPINIRLRRLLVMLPWLMERENVSTQEMADHFLMSVDDLVADLTLASLCGVSQDPRDLIDLWVDEDEVHFGIPKYFDRPLRLTVTEAFSLVASAAAAEQIPGADADGALSRAIAKVQAVLAIDNDDSFAIDLGTPDTVAPLVDAALGQHIVEFDYWSVATGQSVRRRVVPIEVFAERDHWYVRSFDTEAQAERTFRLDRLDDLQTINQSMAVTPSARGEWFSSLQERQIVTLEVDPSWLWVLEQYSGVAVSASSATSRSSSHSWVTVEIVVSSERWLQRVLLRFGCHARLVAPSEWTDLAGATAELVLARYVATKGSSSAGSTIP
ncbi:unannotated protein [freshwater metagenome]|uniref:Unannotated protein n=1 Tax=freshwater metagenome TaxID=449393 RepID=A0A6J6VRQ9_9ZZZZ|nr:WYL domain-containing protein [Actinomycetota bacterium]